MVGILKVVGVSSSKERGSEGSISEEITPDNGWYVLAGWGEIDERDEDYPPNFKKISEDMVAVFTDKDAKGRSIIDILGMVEGDRLINSRTGDVLLEVEGEGSWDEITVDPGDEYLIERNEFDEIRFKIVE